MLEHLHREIPGYRNGALDIRDRERVLALLDETRPDLIVHTLEQGSSGLQIRACSPIGFTLTRVAPAAAHRLRRHR